MNLGLFLVFLLFPSAYGIKKSCKKAFNSYDIQSSNNLRSYLKQKPVSTLEKMASISLYLPEKGLIVDMGFGTGRTSESIALMYPEARIIAVDNNPQMIEHAKKTYHQKNLSYKLGDISKKIFKDGSVDAIINSSVIHHVTSFSKKGYDVLEGVKALSHQFDQLKQGGLLILRDFVIPKGPYTARLRLNMKDGKNLPDLNLNTVNPRILNTLSTFQIFKLFAHQFRSSVHSAPVPYKIIEKHTDWAIVESDFRTLVEFMNHRNFTQYWSSEIKEEYLYMTQQQLESVYQLNQSRILLSQPIYQEWIYKNYFKGKMELLDTQNKPLPPYPTKILIIGEKVRSDEGVKIVEKDHFRKTSKYLTQSFMKHKKSNQIFQIISRPNRIYDIMPFFQKNNQLYIVSRKNYPRGIINAHLETPHLKGMNSGGYVNEPLVLESKDKNIDRVLSKKFQDDFHIQSIDKSSFYYPSEGLIAEKVTPYFVKIDSPLKLPKNLTYTEIGHALRAFQIGGSFDSRIEINIYRLLKKYGISFGEWIVTDNTKDFIEISLPKNLKTFSFKEYQKQKQKSWVETQEETGYAKIKTKKFVEENFTGFKIKEEILEYITPKKISHHTLSLLPVFKSNGEIYVGLELRDLPVPQIFEDRSLIPTVPAYRIPHMHDTLTSAKKYSLALMEKDFGVKVKRIQSLGQDYRASMGITPEIVYPFFVEVQPQKQSQLYWIPLNKLFENETDIRSAHLLTSLFRFYHYYNNN